MKNDHLPLIQALKNKGKKGQTDYSPSIQAPRTFEIQHNEVTGLPGRKVGEQISVRLSGHIHSQHNDGHAVMHVNSVKPDTSKMEGKQYPEQNVPERGVDQVRVRTQQSHA